MPTSIEKNEFAKYIKAFDFQSLFIEGLGWNNDKNTQTVTVDTKTYTLQSIAEKSGFRILVCAPSSGAIIPPLHIRKQIETKISKIFHEHIIIFVDAKKEEQRWMSTIRRIDKKPMEIAWYAHQSPQLLYQRVAGLGFELNEEDKLTIVDVTSRVAGNFSQNNERVTKKFYEHFKNEHGVFLNFIDGIEDAVSREWYASLMLNRLMFCYFIQKRGFLDNGDRNYLSNKLRACREKQGRNKFYSFYRNFLLVLFHKGFGLPNHSKELTAEIGRIPYLNGGLFEVHEIEKTCANITIPDEAFERIFTFFDRYHWHLDTGIEADGDNINPDVIGYIFEKYINDRAKMGAYYTKEDITGYISKNTIIPFLLDKVKSILPEVFAEGGGFWQYLQDSGGRYIYDAVKHGVPDTARSLDDIEIPANIRIGIDKTAPNLLERRKDWNTPTPNGLPTEIWRETITRWERYFEIKRKIRKGEIHEINDLITYNLDMPELVKDYLAQTGFYKFVYEFYFKGLKQITVLDPTCGSGAFLFAAMNILAPLYEVCIARMEDFLRGGVENKDFLYEIDDINKPDHPNRQYFIHKTIILNNLFGVDIMNEAAEIAKLRLFLKLVAQVDPNPKAENYGLEPLPDIDFNIRCGNTLVGFATQEQLYETVKQFETEMYYEDKIKELEESCGFAAAAYERFQQIQLTTHDKKHAEIKLNLQEQLKGLESTLDRYLARTYGINPDAKVRKDGKKEYEEWKKSHQPFHWFAEFYKIIVKRGGFDVVIGNPPYVEYVPEKLGYKLINYNAVTKGNIYGHCIERATYLCKQNAYISMICPMSLVKMPTYFDLRKLLGTHTTYYAVFSADSNPGELFDGVKQNVTIFVRSGIVKEKTYTTRFIRFYTDERPALVNNLQYAEKIMDNIVGNITEISIFKKLMCYNLFENSISDKKTKIKLCYKNTSGAQFKVFFDKEPPFSVNGIQQNSTTLKNMYFGKSVIKTLALATYNSSLFNLWWCSLSDGRHITSRELASMSKIDCDDKTIKQLALLVNEFMKDLRHNAKKVTYEKNNGITEYDQYFPRYSKPIIDEIDKVLAKHYGFTEEELDFIINYDIKYRMGSQEGAPSRGVDE